jgi:hypothetical protein
MGSSENWVPQILMINLIMFFFSWWAFRGWGIPHFQRHSGFLWLYISHFIPRNIPIYPHILVLKNILGIFTMILKWFPKPLGLGGANKKWVQKRSIADPSCQEDTELAFEGCLPRAQKPRSWWMGWNKGLPSHKLTWLWKITIFNG